MAGIEPKPSVQQKSTLSITPLPLLFLNNRNLVVAVVAVVVADGH